MRVPEPRPRHGAGWRLAELVSRVLDRDEQDAVWGDLAESGMTDAQALSAILGLVMRRAAAFGMDWRLWAGAVAVVSGGLLLGRVSRAWADSGAISAFLYVNEWTPAFLASPGARRDIVGVAAMLVVRGLALGAWSWAAGLALGLASGRAFRSTATMFCLVVTASTLGTASGARTSPLNDAVFAIPFYSAALPLLVLVGLVLCPSACGMKRARRSLRRQSTCTAHD